jgi:hypothetical protein
LLLTRQNELEDYNVFLERLADIATLVARYNVLESMYQNWEAMTLEKDYEDSLISLCTHVLEYLGGILDPHTKFSISVVDHSDCEFAKIVEADRACRGFTVTIEDNMTPSLDQIEDVSSEDEDSDYTTLGTKIEPTVGESDQRQSLKRAAGQMSDGDPGVTNGESQGEEIIGVIESARAKRVKPEDVV